MERLEGYKLPRNPIPHSLGNELTNGREADLAVKLWEQGNPEEVSQIDIEPVEMEALREQSEQLKHILHGDLDFRTAISYGALCNNSQAHVVVYGAIKVEPDILNESQKLYLSNNPTKDPELNRYPIHYKEPLIIKAERLSHSAKLTRKYEIVEQFNNDYPKTPEGEELDKLDKLDGMEALMAIEDAVLALLKIGAYSEARDILKTLSTMKFEEGDDEFRDVYLELTARLSLSQLTLAKSFNVSEISQQQIDKLLKSNDFEVLMALGYFGLVDEKKLLTLSPQARIAIVNGTKLSINPIGDENYSHDVLTRERTKHTAKSFINTAFSESDINLAREELEKEIEGEFDIAIIGRLLKGLIERGDTRSKEIAVELFQREDLPDHFRMYVARKLCDSGHWARQIINHFREYQTQGGDTVRIETLSAIIKQMHLTPTLEVYKVLEQTKVLQGSEALDKVCDFGRKIFTLSNVEIKGKLDIFSFWAKKVQSGEIGSENLDHLNNCINTITTAVEQFWNKTHIDKRHNLVNHELEKILVEPTILTHTSQVEWYLKNGILPTLILLQFAKENEDFEGEIARLLQLTEDGHFDQGNLVQRDLEYVRFLKMPPTNISDNYYSDFQELKIIDQIEARALNLQESMEAEAAAYEAAALFWLVKGRVDQGRKVSVVGNRRYGDYFVADVLRREFEDIGVVVSSYKIGSSGLKDNALLDVFPDSFISGVCSENPDIIIVDGTPNSLLTNGMARLPSAMEGYDKWFEIYNETVGSDPDKFDEKYDKREELKRKIAPLEPHKEYEIAFWSPMKCDTVTLGHTKITKPNEIPDTDSPVVILANPVIDPKKAHNFPEHLWIHQPGFFDDPEKYIGGEKKIGFGKTGVIVWVSGHIAESEYVNLVQNRMIRIMGGILRKTDPLFQFQS